MNNFEQVKIQTKQCALCYANEVIQKQFTMFTVQLRANIVCPSVGLFLEKRKKKTDISVGG